MTEVSDEQVAAIAGGIVEFREGIYSALEELELQHDIDAFMVAVATTEVAAAACRRVAHEDLEDSADEFYIRMVTYFTELLGGKAVEQVHD